MFDRFPSIAQLLFLDSILYSQDLEAIIGMNTYGGMSILLCGVCLKLVMRAIPLPAVIKLLIRKSGLSK